MGDVTYYLLVKRAGLLRMQYYFAVTPSSESNTFVTDPKRAMRWLTRDGAQEWADGLNAGPNSGWRVEQVKFNGEEKVY